MTNREEENKIRENTPVLKIDIRGYDIRTVEESLSKIINRVIKMGLVFSGPIFLPVKRELVTVLRSPHKHKDAREQLERRIHKRSIYIKGIKKTHSDYFSDLQMPYSVEINVKLISK